VPKAEHLLFPIETVTHVAPQAIAARPTPDCSRDHHTVSGFEPVYTRARLDDLPHGFVTDAETNSFSKPRARAMVDVQVTSANTASGNLYEDVLLVTKGRVVDTLIPYIVGPIVT
tara:strand:+ start:24418 stop:24762 length:345 start_codon:yes stop_codon:yes gene_type:complete